MSQPKDREIGIIFVSPWNYPGPWALPRVVRAYYNDNESGTLIGKIVALSFGRVAFVIDVRWWRGWIK